MTEQQEAVEWEKYANIQDMDGEPLPWLDHAEAARRRIAEHQAGVFWRAYGQEPCP